MWSSKRENSRYKGVYEGRDSFSSRSQDSSVFPIHLFKLSKMLLSTHHVALILAAAGSALTAPTGPAAVQDTASDIRLTGGMCHIDIFREEPLEIHGSKEPFVLQAAIYDDGNNKKGELLRTRCQATTDTGGQRCTFRSGIADEFASLSPIFKKADETPERDYVEVTLVCTAADLMLNPLLTMLLRVDIPRSAPTTPPDLMVSLIIAVR